MRIWNSLPMFVACRLLVLTAMLSGGTNSAHGQSLIPGTGQKLTEVGDDFEEADWEFIANLPKSSNNVDHQVRQPLGQSKNGRWYESPKRGQPDVLKRVSTPAGGLPGSKGAMLMRSLYTGVPGVAGRRSRQDDLLVSGQSLSVSYSPSVVVRVFLPPFEEWEDNTGTSFGLRAGVQTTTRKTTRRFLFAKTTRKIEPYYPGMFIEFHSKTDPEYEEDSAVFIVRGDEWGQDFLGPQITQTGWWTLGMSFTPDGRVHYYASPGVDDLTAADKIASHHPYGYRCEIFNTFFFNVCNQNNGRSWSTEWIIDDPSVYYIPR